MTVNAGDRTTGASIAMKLRELFDGFDRLVVAQHVPILDRVEFITADGGSNVRRAIEILGKVHVSCVAHLLQLALHDFSTASPNVAQVLLCARSIVGSFSRSSAARLAVGRLRTMVSTRFDTAYLSLKSLLDRIDKLRTFVPTAAAVREDLEDFLDNVDLAEAILDATSTVAGLSDQLSRRSDASAAYVLPCLGSKLAEIEGKVSRSSGVRRDMLVSFLACYRARVESLFQDSLFLNAYFFSSLSATVLADERFLGSPRSNPDGLFSRFATDHLVGDVNILSTVAGFDFRVVSRSISKEELWRSRGTGFDGVLSWYARECGVLGSTASVYQFSFGPALRYLVALPTEVDVERLFSHAGLLMTNRRTRMKTSTLAALLRVRLHVQ